MSYIGGFLLLIAQTASVVCAAWAMAVVLTPKDRPFLRFSLGLFLGMLEVSLLLQFLGAFSLLSRWPVAFGSIALSGLVWWAARFLDGRWQPLASIDAFSPGADAVDRVAGEVAATHLGTSTPEAAGAVATDAAREDTTGGQGSGASRTGGSRSVLGRSLAEWVRIGTVSFLVGAATVVFLTSLLKPAFGTDAVGYHLPDIAHFLRSHSVLEVQQYQLGVYQGVYPMNAELLSAWFVLPFGQDFLVNFGTICQILFAVAAVGALAEHFRVRGGDALLVGLAVVSMPILATSHVGSVANDILPLGALALGLLFVDRWRQTEAPLDMAMAGLVCGMAFGTKVTTVVYLAPLVLTLLVLGMRRRRFTQIFLLFPGLAVLPGVFWVVRNWVQVGNPLWPLDFWVFDGAYVRSTVDRDSILDFLREDGLLALGTSLGVYLLVPLLVTVVILAGAPGIRTTLQGDRTRVWLFVGLPLTAVFLLWPQDWTGGDGGYNIPATVRYISLTYAVLLVVAVAGLLAGKHADIARVGLLLATLFGAAISFLAPTLNVYRVDMRALGLGGLAGLGTLLLLLLPRVTHPERLLFAGAGVLGLCSPVLLASHWDSNWYRNVYDEGLATLYQTVQDLPVQDSKILVAGVTRQYPLVGRDFSNDVSFLGKGDRIAPWEKGDANAWLSAVQETCADYVAVYDDAQTVSQDGREVLQRGDWLHEVPELGFVERLSGAGITPVVETRDDDGGLVMGLYRVERALSSSSSC